MNYMAPATIGAGFIGGQLQGAGERAGLRAASNVLGSSINEQNQLTQQQLAQQQGMFQPYIDTGMRGMGDYENFRMAPQQQYQRSQFGGVDLQQDTGMQFRMQQGVNALDSSAANRGNLFSGAQQKALARFGQDLGSQEFQNAYDRQYGAYKDAEDATRAQFNTQQDRQMNLDQYRMNQLQNLSNLGMQGTQNLSSQFGNIQGRQQNNLMDLRGAQADIQGALAANPMMTLGKGISGAGNAAGSYYGARGA